MERVSTETEQAQATQPNVSHVSARCLPLNSNMTYKMQANIEQRYATKFCDKVGRSASKPLLMIRTVYEDAALSSAQVFIWQKTFKDGRETTEDNVERPSTSKIDKSMAKVRFVLARDRWLTFRVFAHEVSMTKGTVTKACEKFVQIWCPRTCVMNKKKIASPLANNYWIA
ncbi:hypothetical protein Trydic_g20762 [Trypoxylus dichotomus]